MITSEKAHGNKKKEETAKSRMWMEKVKQNKQRPCVVRETLSFFQVFFQYNIFCYLFFNFLVVKFCFWKTLVKKETL